MRDSSTSSKTLHPHPPLGTITSLLSDRSKREESPPPAPMPRQPRGTTPIPASSDGDQILEFVDSMLDGFCDDGFREYSVAMEMPEKKYKSKNLDAERRRRTKLNGRLYDLRALVPKITKMSKESTLTDAIDYILQLQKQVQDLQAELSKEEEAEKQGSASTTETKPSLKQIARIQEKFELSQVGSNKFHVKIICENKRGGFTALLEAVSRLGLEVAEVSSVAFSGASQCVLCIEAKDDGHVVPLAELKKLLVGIVGASDMRAPGL